MSREKCTACKKKRDIFHRVETDGKTYLFCKNCLKGLFEQTLKENQLLKMQISKSTNWLWKLLFGKK